MAKNGPTNGIHDALAEKPDGRSENLDGQTNTGEEGDDEHNAHHLTGFRLISVIASLGVALFISALDQSIVSTLIPTLTDDFNSTKNTGWFGSIYLLLLGAFQLPYGKLYSTYSVKIVFLVSMAWLEIGSLTCALAKNAATFIAGRALAGLGAAGILSGVMIIVSMILPLRLRPLYGGILGSLEGLAVIAGPVIGGAIATNIGWPWAFWINLPAGGLLCIAIILFLNVPPSKSKDLTLKQQVTQLDIPGSALLLVSIICLLIALDWGGITYAWSNPRIIVLFVVFGITLVAFAVYLGVRGEQAMIPTRVLKSRSFLSCVWYGFCIASSQMVLIYNLPIWFQIVKNATASASGRMLLPTVIAVIVGGILAGWGGTAIGYLPPFMLLGTVLSSIGTGLIYTFSPNTPSPRWIGYQVIYGLGCGAGVQQPLVGVQVALAEEDIPTGTACVMLGNTLGGAVFISVAQNIFINRLRLLANMFPNLDVETLLGNGLTALLERLTPSQAEIALVQYNSAIQHVFLLATILACLSIFGSSLMKWTKIKKQGVDKIGSKTGGMEAAESRGGVMEKTELDDTDNRM